MPRRLDSLREMKPLKFQEFITGEVGQCNTKMSADGGIDGYTHKGTPLQVKKMARIGKNIVVLFANALKRLDFNRGIIIAFSFTSGALQQTVWHLKNEGICIALLTVEQLVLMTEEMRDNVELTAFSLMDKFDEKKRLREIYYPSQSRDAEADRRGGPSSPSPRETG